MSLTVWGADFKPEKMFYNRVDDTVPIEPSADVIEFDQDNEKLILSGKANIIHGDYSITADEIVVDTLTNFAHAEGNVVLWFKGSTVCADSLEYDIATNESTLVNAYTQQGAFRVWDATVTVNQDRSLDIDGGRATACDLAIPHYHIGADTIKIIPEERLWIYDAMFKVGDIPAVYLPVFTRSLKERWYSYIFHPGYSSKKGAIAINKFIFHLHPLLRLNFFVDAYSKLGPGFGFRESYKGKDLYGTVYGYYIKQDEEFHEDEPYVSEERYKIAGSHWQKLAPDTTLTARYEFLSDPEFNDDYDEEEIIRGWLREDLNYRRNSFVNLAKTMPELNLRVTYKSRSNDFFYNGYPEEERLPQLHIEAKKERIPNTPFTYEAHVDISRLHEELRSPYDTGIIAEEKVNRFEGGGEIGMPLTFFERLRLNPFVGYRATHYDDPTFEYGNTEDVYDDETRNSPYTGIEATTRLWFPMNLSWLSFKNLSPTRLVIEPSVRYEYFYSDVDLDDLRSDRGIEGNFPFIDSYDLPRFEGSRITPVLDLSFEGKNSYGGTDKILHHFLYTAYDFETDRDAAGTVGGNYQTTQEGHWTDLYSDFFYYPADWLSFASYIRYNLNLDEIRASNHTLWFSFWKKWRMGLGHTYFDEGLDAPHEENASIHFGFDISKKYSISYTHRHDLEENRTRENRITLRRDLHDLVADLVLKERKRIDRDREYEVYLLLTLKLPGGRVAPLVEPY